MDTENKQRIIQEFVPGKQITLAHIVANPTVEIYIKLGLDYENINALGIMTITPSEGAIIAADIASKASDISIGFIDRFNGSLIITGDVSAVESALKAVLYEMNRILNFALPEITKT